MMTTTTATWAGRAAASIFPDVVGRLPASSNTIYLTFDDGPSHRTTDVLDLLQQLDAAATFFLRGDRIEHHTAEAQRILEDGHGVGNHAYRHVDAWRSPWSKVRVDLEQGDRAILSLTGCEPQWVRPPFGHLRQATRAWCRARRQRLALWDVMAGDFRSDADQEAVAKQAAALVRSGSIVVLHDGDEQQPNALGITERLLTSLREVGWTFERLPDS